MLKILLVDDEAAARRGMRILLERAGNVSVVGDCKDGAEAMEQLRRMPVDAVFLDVEMPGRSGVEVAREIAREGGPDVVFLTAFEEYAVKAFEQDAVDYLLKPVSIERLQRTLERLRRHRAESQSLRLRSGSEHFQVPCAEIRWVEAAGDYVCVHTTRRTLIVPKTLGEMEVELDHWPFARVHRSAIVNANFVRGLRGLVNRDAILEMDRGEEVRVSRTHRARLEAVMNGPSTGGHVRAKEA